ncbi:MAG: hypothetical protein PVG50_00245 [Thiohalophilus sp.]|jgi:energy-coupling factor transport system permease protein
MHPVIRISCFVLFCIALVRPNREQLIFAALVLAGSLAFIPLSQWRRVFGMLRRLRWLLLSVLVIYGWFSPGELLQWPLPEYLLPSRQGLELGLLRVLILVLILLAAGILLTTTSRDQLIAALFWLLTPLRALHVPVERVAVRLALTLHYVESQAPQWRAPEPASDEGLTTRINRIARHLAGVLPRLFSQAGQKAEPVQLDVPSPPSLIQWGWPVLLAAGFIAGAYFQI